MELTMFLGNELIDRISLNEKKIGHPGYIERLRMDMEEKNEDILDLSSENPQFFIENMPSSMNATRKLYDN